MEISNRDLMLIINLYTQLYGKKPSGMQEIREIYKLRKENLNNQEDDVELLLDKRKT